MRCLLLLSTIVTGCAGPSENSTARAFYRTIPETATIGIIAPLDDTLQAERTLVTVGFTWRIRPSIPPVAY